MAVTTVVNETGVHVRLTGWESVFGFARREDQSVPPVSDSGRSEHGHLRRRLGVVHPASDVTTVSAQRLPE